jgi:ATP-dependent DNA ligase
MKMFPEFVPPMMAESAKAPFDSPDWIFEIKLDGYRAITVFDPSGKPHFWSRNGLALEAKFPAIAKAVSKLELGSTILDGEIVAVDENRIPRFPLLQRFQKQRTAPTLYYVFDVLWNDGEDATGKKLLARRPRLWTTSNPTVYSRTRQSDSTELAEILRRGQTLVIFELTVSRRAVVCEGGPDRQSAQSVWQVPVTSLPILVRHHPPLNILTGLAGIERAIHTNKRFAGFA